MTGSTRRNPRRVPTCCLSRTDDLSAPARSEIGFGLTRLLGYDLLPRIKQINKVKLYRPGREEENTYDNLADAMTRPIRWDVIENNYDQLVKYAAVIRVGTASTEAILRRFTRTASHPVYEAVLEVGEAQKTIFVSVTWNLTAAEVISLGYDHGLRRCAGHGGAPRRRGSSLPEPREHGLAGAVPERAGARYRGRKPPSRCPATAWPALTRGPRTRR
ncbi:Tn3 family transposase [Streptomyces sp. NPDC056835]|uniref:Tn3 family transposase n=1 Tax=Streptomyces sp. NPDC056835 TaxID=3345956 RepID=UPI0036846D60